MFCHLTFFTLKKIATYWGWNVSDEFLAFNALIK